MPVVIDVREDSNIQWDFFKFIYSVISEGYLKSGDFLVCDNASGNYIR